MPLYKTMKKATFSDSEDEVCLHVYMLTPLSGWNKCKDFTLFFPYKDDEEEGDDDDEDTNTPGTSTRKHRVMYLQSSVRYWSRPAFKHLSFFYLCIIHRILNRCSANCGLGHIHTIHKRGEDAVRSCSISSFSVKTLSPSENRWTCRSTRYPCLFLYFKDFYSLLL